MTSFSEALEQGRFLVTTEEPPPRGPETAAFFRRTSALAGVVDAINLTEASGANLAMSPSGLVPGLVKQGHAPILQLTCRDRNRIALQAEALAGGALGAEAVVAMSGDPVEGGDHPDATAVHDIDTLELLSALRRLTAGEDMAGNALNGVPSFAVGAVVNPGADDIDREIARMERKAEAGAQFFQTQAVYEPKAFEAFMRRVEHLQSPVLATYIVPRSGDMARRMNRSVPGVHIPAWMIERLDAASDPPECAIEISATVLRELASMCRGLHVIAVGWEARLASILSAAGVDRVRA